jgi:signal transduction histidine kinase
MRLNAIVFIFCFLQFSSFAQDQYVVDSILLQIDISNKEELEPLFSELAWQFMNADIEKSHNFALKAKDVAEEIKDSSQLSDAYNTLGATFFRKGEYSSSLEYNNKALEIRKHLNDIRGMGGSHSKIGIVYTDQGLYDDALFHQLKALDLFIQSEDITAEAQTYNNICQIYSYLDNLDMAIAYANKCIKIYQEVDYPYGEASAVANLAIYYEKREMLDSCIFFLIKAKDIFESINDKVDVATSENTIGLYYRKLGNNEQGLKHYQKAYDISVAIEDYASVSQYGANLAATLLDLDQNNKAFDYYNKSLELAKDMTIQRVERQCYDGLANFHEKTGNYKEALGYRRLYDEINKIITGEEIQKEMIQADAKFQNTLNQKLLAEQKLVISEKEKEQQIANNIIAENQLKIKSTQLWWTITISFVFLGLVFFLWYSNKRKLTMQKEFSDSLAKEKELGLQMTLEGQEQERQRIAKDLHDGVVQEIVAIKFDVAKIKEEELQHELLQRLDKTANEVRNISHQMMPFALKELGLMAAAKDLLERLLIPSGVQYEFNEVGDFTKRLPEKIEVSLYRILQELVNNVLKHSKANNVSVTFSKRNGNLLLVFEDNGRGMQVGVKMNGLGMTSLDSRVKMLKGKIEFESEVQSGTTAIVNIPLQL